MIAALQFEWAWQHPDKSRHLRDTNGEALFVHRRPKHLKANLQIVRTMVSNHPYHNWPLHVKLFTEEAVMAWKDAIQDIAQSPLPLGFTYTVELEGVDGKSGRVGSGRDGPISVKDEQFTSSYLAKSTAFLATNPPLHCSVCQEVLENYATDALSTALCPSPTCTAVSHLSCLSKRFLDADITTTALVPRGGICTSCNTYTLWGDVIRGCYRRNAGGIAPEEYDIPESDQGELYESDSEPGTKMVPPRSPIKNPIRPKVKCPVVKERKKVPQKKAARAGAVASSSEGELFDYDDVSSTDELPDTPRKRGRPPKSSPPAATPTTKRKAITQKGRPKQKNILCAGSPSSSERELFDCDVMQTTGPPESLRKRGRPKEKSLRPTSPSSDGEPFDVHISSTGDTPRKSKSGRPRNVSRSALGQPNAPDGPPPIPRKRGRPLKSSSIAIAGPSVPQPQSSKTVAVKRATQGRPKKLGKKHCSTDSSSGESFDFGAISDASSEHEHEHDVRLKPIPSKKR
ncbi:hypothetical protein D9615_004967 [Tricholomella constricta]|uniref:Structure-specific endonuclease subunit SLX1 C-terminal domain-containing protein n=1 Tax=Tricholomella constricta TaxID=117010 RepID=A0A8H5HGT5_9AGAR|nr:hypothetical protein D9615_004967 [Tricholomella constricta]